MKFKHKTSSLLLLFIYTFTTFEFASTIKVKGEPDCDSMEVLKQYSLFSEYHKNKDYASALPFGWNVLNCNPVRFNKWIFYKMEDCFWYLHDSAGVTVEQVQLIEDTIIFFYDIAITYYADGAGYFGSRKAFTMETWLNFDPVSIISEYEKAIEIKPDISSYYYNRLGQLYIVNKSDANDYKMKAIDLYTSLVLREPDNPAWLEELKKIIEDPKQLLEIYKKIWYLDKQNIDKAWDYASIGIRNKFYEETTEPLLFLTQRSPETIDYWSQLAAAYQGLNQLPEAEEVLIKLITMDPDNQNHYLNIAIVYQEQKNFNKARQYFQTASEKGSGWALPVFYEGNLYEKAAMDCEFNFEAKMVYQLAIDTYRKAFNLDPNLTQAKDRANALSDSVPSKEDYFFRGYKTGQVLPITGKCYNWIGRSITVP